MMLAWNRHVNLTRIIQPEEAARFHYAESIFAVHFVEGSGPILDIGSGAGFPAIPLAVALPEIQITALEANQKKALFLAEARDRLNLHNLKIVRERLERFDTSHYQLVVSRALDQASRMLLPLVDSLKSDQRLLLFCSQRLVDELRPAVEAACEFTSHPIPLAEDRLIAIFKPI
jgi:16S rRNA (guanine527-N7)-methyltransferase